MLILTTMKLLSSTRKGLTLVMIKYTIASKNMLLMRLLDMQAIINTQINNLFDLLIKWDFLIWVTEKIDTGRSAVVENQMCIPTSWGLKKFHLLLIQPFEWRASYLRDQNSFTTSKGLNPKGTFPRYKLKDYTIIRLTQTWIRKLILNALNSLWVTKCKG